MISGGFDVGVDFFELGEGVAALFEGFFGEFARAEGGKSGDAILGFDSAVGGVSELGDAAVELFDLGAEFGEDGFQVGD